MNMLSTGLGLSADVNLSKIPFPNRNIGKTLCSSLEDGSSYETVFKTNAAKYVILVFPSCANRERILPLDFSLASFDGTFSETLGDQKAGVQSMIDKLKLSAEEVHSWMNFWRVAPKEPMSLSA